MIITGHALDVLQTLASESTDCMVTSPPYWGLRDYGTPPVVWDARDGCSHHWGNERVVTAPGAHLNADFNERWNGSSGERRQEKMKPQEISQGSFCSLCGAWRGSLGLEPQFTDYIRHLMQVMEQVWRVLKPTGSAWINLGDSYGGNQGRGSGKGNEYGQKVKQSAGLAKSLCAIPDRFKIAMIDAGWICRNTLIWHKLSAMPSSAKDRFTVDFEYIHFFVKQPRYYFQQQLEPLAESTARDKRMEKEDFTERRNERDYPGKQQQGSGMLKPTAGKRNRRCVWTINPKPSSEPHYAMFPDTLVEPMLSAGCPIGGVVLDPFSGMGTVGLVAARLGMDFIGIELNPDYAAKSQVRIEEDAPLFTREGC